MKKKMVGLLLLLPFAAGCPPSAFTSIRKIDDNTYMITRTTGKSGGTYGTLLTCRPIGQSPDLQCSELGEP
jgi:hypothetical protein